MPVVYLDPMGSLALESMEYRLAIDTSKRPLRIGLVANGFVDSDRFRDALGRAVAVALDGVELRLLEKPDPVAHLTDEQLVELHRCDASAIVYAH